MGKRRFLEYTHAFFESFSTHFLHVLHRESVKNSDLADFSGRSTPLLSCHFGSKNPVPIRENVKNMDFQKIRAPYRNFQKNRVFYKILRNFKKIQIHEWAVVFSNTHCTFLDHFS